MSAKQQRKKTVAAESEQRISDAELHEVIRIVIANVPHIIRNADENDLDSAVGRALKSWFSAQGKKENVPRDDADEVRRWLIDAIKKKYFGLVRKRVNERKSEKVVAEKVVVKEADPMLQATTRATVEVVQAMRESLSEQERAVFDAKLAALEEGNLGFDKEITDRLDVAPSTIYRIWARVRDKLKVGGRDFDGNYVN